MKTRTKPGGGGGGGGGGCGRGSASPARIRSAESFMCTNVFMREKSRKPVADTGGGQTRPMPPLTNKDTPPVHCNEFNYMSSATHCRSSLQA